MTNEIFPATTLGVTYLLNAVATAIYREVDPSTLFAEETEGKVVWLKSSISRSEKNGNLVAGNSHQVVMMPNGGIKLLTRRLA